VRAIRASIAIPGVLPPVPNDGDLLVDGGVLDNVPVDEMRRRNPTGKVIAVDVAPVEGPVAERDYGLSASGLRSMLMRRRGVGPPNLISTMVRSSIIGSVRDRHRVVEEEVADLYLDVAVDGGSMLDFSAGEQIADGAADATRPILDAWFRGSPTAPTAGYVRTSPARRAIIDPASSRRRLRRGGVLLLTLRDLQYRAARFGAVVLGTSVVLTLLFLMTGLTEQFHREPRDTVASFDADGWLLRDGASGAFTSAATMPADVATLVQGAAAAPVVVARHSLTEAGGRTDIVVVGFERGRLGEPELRTGRLPRGPGEVAIDDASGLHVGDVARIGDRRYEVTGTTDRRTMFAGMPLVFMELTSAQELLYRGADLATAVVLDGTPTSTPDGFTVVDPATVTEDALRPLERSISSVNLIRVLLWLVAGLIIGTMTYLSALERRRDVAVLKAVGASTTQLGASIALQGALIALVAACVASALQVFMVPVFPLEVTVPSRAFLQVPAIAVVVALAAGAVGLRKAVRTDPALAFAGPGS
jgi:putative ABC transport system permease protein